VSAENRIVAFLMALAQRFPPAPQGRHHLYAEQVGSPVRGWQDTLCLELALRYPVDPIYIDAGDLDKPTDQLVAEVADIVARARDLKRAAAINSGDPQ
jgi:hypothetical protein